VKPHPPDPVAPRATLKTYSHLMGARRVPTDYEIATTRLLYHHQRGLEVQLPFGDWYAHHGAQLAFPDVDWEAFADPRRLTYSGYTSARTQQEAFVAQLFVRLEEAAPPPAAALACFEDEVAPLRFPLHGLQMAAAYLGQLSPASRIAIVCAFQAADEMRRVQHIAYRMGQLRRDHPGPVADESRARWQEAPAWQPLRRLIERLLVAWDWATAFAALQLAVKPLLDEYIAGALATRLQRTGDLLFAEVLTATRADSRWSQEWSEALTHVIATAPSGKAAAMATLEARAAPFRDEAAAAVVALASGAGCT
jgi:toluene monooxygenase system protein E